MKIDLVFPSFFQVDPDLEFFASDFCIILFSHTEILQLSPVFLPSFAAFPRDLPRLNVPPVAVPARSTSFVVPASAAVPPLLR